MFLFKKKKITLAIKCLTCGGKEYFVGGLKWHINLAKWLYHFECINCKFSIGFTQQGKLENNL